MYWGSVFGHAEAAGNVVRIQREVADDDAERVQRAESKTAQFERMTAFLNVERLGLADVVYSQALLRTRSREARELGLATVDAEMQELELSLEEVLAVPRSARNRLPTFPAPPKVNSGESTLAHGTLAAASLLAARASKATYR
jgi:hypothetical protein